MIQPKADVIPFKSGKSNLTVVQQGEMKDRIRSRCRSIYSRHLVEIHHDFFSKLDDELFSLSDKAENSSVQAVYFEAMRFIRRERERIENNLSEILAKEFNDFWLVREDETTSNEAVEYHEDAFSLVENEVLEEGLAISTMVDKMNQILHTELYALDRRFAALLGRVEIDSEANPVGPFRICYAFEGVIKPLLLDLKIKLLIYKLYEKFVSSRLDGVYKEINALLIDEKILPKLSRYVQQSGAKPTVAHNAESVSDRCVASPDPIGLHSPAEAAEQVDPLTEFRVFQELQSLLDGWRSRNASVSANRGGDNAPPIGSVHQTVDVMNVLSQLQVDQLARHIQPGLGLKLALTDQLRSFAPDGAARPLAAPEEDIIDMVGMIFDFILDDGHLPEPVRAVIGRLQIPVIKVAILEKGFFARKSHPVRQLLNKMAKAASVLDRQSVTQSPLYAEIESIVESVLSQFDHDVGLFSDALARLNAFLDKDQQRTRLVEERTRQVTESKEQLEMAKSKIGYALIRCLQGKVLPIFVRSFLNEGWKHVMLLAYLRKDKAAAEWDAALGVVTRLIRTITPVDDVDEKRKILNEIPRLIEDISVGLESISFDSHKTATFLRQLEAWQMKALNEFVDDAESMKSPVFAASYNVGLSKSAPTETKKSDGGLVSEIDALMANMTQVDHSLFNDLDQEIDRRLSAEDDEEAVHSNAGQELPENSLKDRFTEQAESVMVGQWLSFQDEKNDWIKAKLSWKSSVTSRYVFVNIKGVKVAEKSINDLAGELRCGKTLLIEDRKTPAVDRALDAMMQTLRDADRDSPVCV